MADFVDARVTSAGLRRKGVQIRTQMEQFKAEAEQANQKSVDWLRREATKNLEASIRKTGRPEKSSSGKLLSAVDDPASHQASQSGFQFMIYERMYRKAIYWRVIEKGTSQFVGMKVPLAFQSQAGNYVLPNARRAPRDRIFRGERTSRGGRGRPSGMLYGSSRGGDRRQYWVRITKPIEKHGYAEDAVTRFRTKGIYARYINTALKRHQVLGGRLVSV